MIKSLKKVTRYYPDTVDGMMRGKCEGVPVYVKLSDVEAALRSTSTNNESDAITLLKECAAIHGPALRQEWLLDNNERINAVIA